MCAVHKLKCLGMQLKRIRHVDLSGMQMDSQSALTSSGKYSITDVYDVLKGGRILKKGDYASVIHLTKQLTSLKWNSISAAVFISQCPPLERNSGIQIGSLLFQR